jgi:hypothetical protein
VVHNNNVVLRMVPSGRTTTKNNWRSGPVTVSEKQTTQNGIASCATPEFQCANLDTIKGGHKVGCDLSDFFLCRRRALPIGIKDVFERASVLGHATISERYEQAIKLNP